MDITNEEEIKIAEDFRRQPQERFPAYVGDEDMIKTAKSMDSNVAKLRSALASLGPNSENERLDDILHELEDVSLPNPRDEPLTHTIIRSICQEVETACREAGVPLRGGVAYGASPTLEINAEQHLVPTTGTSVVELSVGLINFCSHLSKVMSMSLIHDSSPEFMHVRSDSSEILKKIGQDRELKMLWLELFGAYAYGDGPMNVRWQIVPHPQSLTRVLLLTAFERFAIAHEYGHHIEAHGEIESVGVGGDPGAHDKEIEADIFAVALCRYMERRNKHPNIFLYSGAAPVLLLKCLDYVRRTRRIFASGEDGPIGSTSTHPETDERILAFDSYDNEFSPQQRERFQQWRRDFCSIVDEVWNKLKPFYINMYKDGLRREERPISWLPRSGDKR